jgi:hypothetical protein
MMLVVAVAKEPYGHATSVNGMSAASSSDCSQVRPVRRRPETANIVPNEMWGEVRGA